MSECCILKIGGSVITDKSGDCGIDHRRIAKIAEDISSARIPRLLMIHGAGSCGHPQAKHYRLDQGLSREMIGGVYETHAAVCILNDVVVRALRFHGVEAVGIPPLAAAVAENGRLSSLNADPFDLMMDRGIVPVLHGDVVMDRASGASIVSGDQLVVHLASALGARRVGLATDVPGVLHEGMVIPCLRPEEVASLELGGSSHTDVTGGMRGKIAELSVLAERGIEAHIFHVSRIRDYLEGSDHGGTILGGTT